MDPEMSWIGLSLQQSIESTHAYDHTRATTEKVGEDDIYARLEAAHDELYCAETVLDAVIAGPEFVGVERFEQGFDCLGDYIRAVVEHFQKRESELAAVVLHRENRRTVDTVGPTVVDSLKGPVYDYHVPNERNST